MRNGWREGRVDRRAYGSEGERIAVEYLKVHGYHIRDRNIHCRHGEIDVVAECKETLCFVEVRARSTSRFGGPAVTVMSSKQARVIKAALYYIQKNKIIEKMFRFDVISITGRGVERKVEHITNAFDAGM